MEPTAKSRLYRLIALTLAGGQCGIVTITMVYSQIPESMGYSVAEFQRWGLVSFIGGAIVGVGTELAIRFAERRNFRFSIREFMFVVALFSVALVIMASLVKWADSGNRSVAPSPKLRYWHNY